MKKERTFLLNRKLFVLGLAISCLCLTTACSQMSNPNNTTNNTDGNRTDKNTVGEPRDNRNNDGNNSTVGDKIENDLTDMENDL